MLIVLRAQYYLWLQVFLSHASYVNRESGKYGRYKRLESFWIFMGWFRSQRKENSWTVEIGYHYTRQFGSSEQIKNNFFLNEGIKLELSRNEK